MKMGLGRPNETQPQQHLPPSCRPFIAIPQLFSSGTKHAKYFSENTQSHSTSEDLFAGRYVWGGMERHGYVVKTLELGS